MKILDADFKELVEVLFDTQNEKFDHIYEKEKIERFKKLCETKKLIMLGTGYYLKSIVKYLKIKYGVEVYGVYDWAKEVIDGDGMFAECKDYEYINFEKYDKYTDKAKKLTRDEFYRIAPEDAVVFINGETFLQLPHILCKNGFTDFYTMRNLAKPLLSEVMLNKKHTGFEEYDMNKLNHTFTTPEISRIITLYNLLDDEKSKDVFTSMIKFKLTEDYYYPINIKDDVKLQYLDKDVIKFNDDEVFIDCGGYIGDTVEAFLKAVDDKFKYIYTFEPDERNFKKLEEYASALENKDKISVVNAGVFYKNDTFYLTESGSETMCVTHETELKTDVVAIDDVLKHAPTFIKMDIETFETYALLGAMDSIIKHKPKLSICIYHKFDDLWNIPLLIKQWVPEYKLYIRHYSGVLSETVLYAIPNKK